MSRKLVIADPNGSRSLDAGELPLQIGSSANVDIRISGEVSAAAVALIDLLDDRPFIQPAVDASQITVNGVAITATRWLESGDEIAVRGTSISCQFDDETLRFTVAHDALEYETLPPVIADMADQGEDAEATIAPIRRTKPPAVRPDETGRHRTAWLIGYATLTLLLVTVFYLFTARAVLIDVDPADAHVEIAGGLLKFKFGDRYLLRPGEYRVMLSADGYESLREEIQVGGDDSQDFPFTMRKLPGRLVVDNRAGVEAQVEVDGVVVGSTPTGEISLEPGPHTVRVTTERYQDFETTVDIEGRDVLQSFDAELIPAWADVTVTTAPAGATIYVADAELGETPATVQLMSGIHELLVRKEGFKISRQVITVAANEPAVLPEIRLQEADSLLTVTSQPGGAAVSINGRYRGTTPVEVELGPGVTYEVIISKAGFATDERKVSMESRRGKLLRIELEARVGVVKIVSQPADAELFIDGQPRGIASQELSLPARPHRIEIRKAGYEPFFTEITPKPGMPEVLEVTMLTPEQAILAASPRTITTSQGLQMLLVDPGQFEMGAPRREQGRRPNETQHKVQLTRQFYISTHEITNAQFREFKPKHTSGAEKYRILGDDNHPVVMLSWEEATGYCNWLSHRESQPFAYVVEDGEIRLASPPNTGYRLPTEAEWAWAARYNGGGGKQKYPWGDRLPPTQKSGNYADRSADGILTSFLSNYNDGYPISAPVGKFPASPIGLFDVGGNAAEWVNDRYGVPSSSNGMDIDPVGPIEGQYHVIRGSGWRHASISELRFAYRDFGSRGRLDVGFRIAKYADQPVE